MTASTITADHGHDDHHDTDTTDVFGFWIYIMSDCVIFASLFAAFAVLHNNTYIDYGVKQFLDLPYILAETILLLVSSLTCGMAMLSMYKDKLHRCKSWLFVTLILGLSFVVLEVNEFIHLIHEGHGPGTSAAMSVFFTLVGTHGFHVSMGLLWMCVMLVQLFKFQLSKDVKRRLTYFAMFWAFLDIVWIFVFTIVYLMGGI